MFCEYVFVLCVVDLISIDRRSPDQEARCVERARTLALQFQEKVQASEDSMWNPSAAASTRWARGWSQHQVG